MEKLTLEIPQIAELERKIEELVNKVDSLHLSPKDSILSTREACSYLRVTSRTLQTYRDRKIISYSQVGSKLYYKKSDLDSFVASFRINRSDEE